MKRIQKHNRKLVIIGGSLIILSLIIITILNTTIAAYTVPGILGIAGGIAKFIKVKKDIKK